MYTGFKVMTDCFAYDKTQRYCKALSNLYCARAEYCNFYKKSQNDTPVEKPKHKHLRPSDETRESLSGKVFH